MRTIAVNSPANVLVVGEALVDIVEMAGTRTVHPGGSPANVALGLGRLGMDVALLTDLGRDDHGARIAAHLRASEVRVLDDSFSDRPTSRAIARIGPDGAAEYQFDVRWDPAMDSVPPATLIHTGSIATFLPPGSERVRNHLATATSSMVTLDPNIRPALLGSVTESRATFEAIAALATVVKLSDEDARWLYPGFGPDDVLARVRGLGPQLAVMTMGAAGAMLAIDEVTEKVAAPAVRVVDTIGAGDTYMASLIASVLNGPVRAFTREFLRNAGARAAKAAALTVSRVGADLPTAAEVGQQVESLT